MKKITLLSLICLVFFACRKDSETTTTTTTTEDPTIVIIENFEEEVIEVTASLAGLVIDEQGNPIQGASAQLGNNIETTDENGHFLFKQVTMNAAGTFVTVKKTGYFNGSSRFFPKDNSQNYITIKLMERTPIGNFVSGSGGVVSAANGLKLDFPSNAIVDGTNTSYEGTVEVAARWIDPSAQDLFEIMPGNLQGINRLNQEVAMGSFSMMAVELTGENGQPLNLGNSQKAELTFPIPDELLNKAPEEIPLWSFNETLGLWVEEGSATLEGNTYVGSVSHFSFWNCDAPFPLVYVNGRVVNENGVPIANAYVQVTILSSGWGAGGITNGNGYFAGKLPKDEALGFKISQNGNCAESSTIEIGPFSEDTDIGDVVVTDADLIELTGTIVDCAGNPVTSSWLTYTLGNQTGYFYLENNNVINVAMFNCNAATELTVTGINLDDLEQSDEITFAVSPNIDLGEISACGNTLDEFIKITVNGDQLTLLFPDGGYFQNITQISVSDSLSNGYFNLGFVENSPGTYDANSLGSFYFNLEFPNVGYINMECGGTSCGLDELVITEYGAVGGKIKGTFSGTTDFWDNSGNTLPNLPYSGSFEVTRDQ